MDYLLHSLHAVCTHCFYVNSENVAQLGSGVITAWMSVNW